MRTRWFLVFLYMFVVAGPSLAFGKIIFVNWMATGSADGTTWADAFNEVESGLSIAEFGDEIWVAQGCYYATLGTDREATLSLVDGVAVYGGFLGIEVNRKERSPDRNLTVFDGEIGDQETVADNTERILTAIGVGPDTILDGFTVQNANNDTGDDEAQGGGLYALDSAMQIVDCTFQLNVSGGGAGIWAERGNLLVTSCRFLNNENSGMTYLGGSPVLIKCLFQGNMSHFRGGGYNGGVDYQVPYFTECLFVENSTDGRGGAYFGLGDANFVNCRFTDNKSGESGGAAYLHIGRAVFTNCTVYGNRSGFNAGGIQTHSSDSVIVATNCVLWGNRSRRDPEIEGNQIVMRETSVINNCCVEGWTGRYGGVGNFGDDPQFVNADKENLRLRDDSPCFDAGDDSVVTQSTDLDGNPRILGARVDIGCYESLCPAIVALDLKCTSSGKLKATATTTLPEGATVRFTQPDAQGRPKPHPAAVNRRGKAVAKWRPDSDAPVCIEGCSQPCTQQACP